ncbi:MAG: hypothetical protein SGCHY_002917 [Lobulomycetales sp.]
MMEGLQPEDLMPRQGKQAGDFFQTDSSIARQEELERKQKIHAKSGNPVKVPSKVLALAAAPSAGGDDDEIVVYTAESGFSARRMLLPSGTTTTVFSGLHQGPVTCIALLHRQSSTGALEEDSIITGSWDKSAVRWDVHTGKQIASYANHHTDFIKDILVSRETGRLYTASADKTIRVWDLSTAEVKSTLKGHSRAVEALALDPESGDLFSGSSDTTIRRWDTQTGSCTAVINGHATSVYALTFCDGVLWSASADKYCMRWDLSRSVPDTKHLHPDFVKCVAVTDEYVFTGCRDEGIRVYALATDRLVHVFSGHCGEVSTLAVVGGLLVSGSLDGTVRQWRIKDIGTLSEVEIQGAVPVEENVSPMTAEEEAELLALMD